MKDSEARIVDLEITVAEQDLLLQTLNDVVAEQQLKIQHLQAQLTWLFQNTQKLEPEKFLTTIQEIPPHY